MNTMTYVENIREITVVNLEGDAFHHACAKLMTLVETHWQPDVIVGIRSGGLHVANSMAQAAKTPVPVLAITCRRPTTRLKPMSNAARQLISKLPRSILDWLRVIEHKVLTRAPKAPKPGTRRLDDAELAELEKWLASAGPSPSMLVVDDAVDTGVTLAVVMEALLKRAPSAATIRSAVVTLTTTQPVITPDYVLIRHKLCRFPWAMDAQPAG
jgi:hypoxanthine phosphoribosyltransferase